MMFTIMWPELLSRLIGTSYIAKRVGTCCKNSIDCNYIISYGGVFFNQISNLEFTSLEVKMSNINKQRKISTAVGS